jgi:hypothetical protein
MRIKAPATNLATPKTQKRHNNKQRENESKAEDNTVDRKPAHMNSGGPGVREHPPNRFSSISRRDAGCNSGKSRTTAGVTVAAAQQTQLEGLIASTLAAYATEASRIRSNARAADRSSADGGDGTAGSSRPLISPSEDDESRPLYRPKCARCSSNKSFRCCCSVSISSCCWCCCSCSISPATSNRQKPSGSCQVRVFEISTFLI